MRIEKVHIKGFRNFDDTEITVGKKVLMIGANDVGKTNFIYALRLLFDKSISEHDLELSDEDYNAYTNPQSIEITVFINVPAWSFRSVCFIMNSVQNIFGYKIQVIYLIIRTDLHTVKRRKHSGYA